MSPSRARRPVSRALLASALLALCAVGSTGSTVLAEPLPSALTDEPAGAAPAAVPPAGPATVTDPSAPARPGPGATTPPGTGSAPPSPTAAGSATTASGPSASGTAATGATGPVVVAGARGDIPVERFGAVGDGVTDDTAALQQALDSVPTGSILRLRAGATYLHSDVLRVRTPGLTVLGRGATVTATQETRSAFHVDADRVVVEGVTFALATSTERFHAYEQMKVRVSADGVVLRDVHVRGAAAAGFYVGNGSGHFLLDRVTVVGSRADGVHVTGGAHDGRVVSPVTTATGDDGVAVVSYRADGVPCARVEITSPQVNGTTWGRGISVVGGDDITYTDVAVRDTDAAAVYVGSEGDPYYTFPSRRVRISRGTVTGANTNSAKDHGAVLVYAGNSGTTTADVTIRDLAVSGTRAGASWELGVLADPGAGVQRVTFSGISLTGGPSRPFHTNASPAVRLFDVSDDGFPVPEHRGW
ncbi:glycosyl hydrolase family 28-related protein [Modestobacter sp. VKM Ac-2983]|uniref:glycosyl hydrolase family 28-related protein n=1 Tax=Modestobacter sp. VKM Ac-2983 TaxID=3004137 RepID=UPI0022ABA435|nr:glycosyl hydrolase family 28-related protein [Modestobacter sp. VKM Ac-2983]MCZ2803701.1 glycosyl hydrolase family 28-related protein [Modestobacter sp. VKM Ac-2983]